MTDTAGRFETDQLPGKGPTKIMQPERYSHHNTAPLALALFTAAFAILAMVARIPFESPPLWQTNLTHLPLDIWGMASYLPGLGLTLVLILLSSTVPAVRTQLTREVATHPDRDLLLALTAAMLILAALYLLDVEWALFSLGFLVLSAGYIGGPATGLLMGTACTLFVGTRNLFEYSLLEVYGNEGVGPMLGSWLQGAAETYVLSQDAAVFIWLGGAAGLLAQTWGKDRWSPLRAGLSGGALTLAGGYLVAINTADPTWVTETLAPQAVVAGVGLAILALWIRSTQAEEARRRAQTAELALLRAELAALRAQINPHFLFNSLNTIRYFVRIEPSTARNLLVDLSDVFQHALHAGDFVSLRAEIRYVEAYLALEKARLDDRLAVAWSLPDDTIMSYEVPTLVLQPIVENAVVHGLAVQEAGGSVSIAIEEVGEHLHITVIDDGAGMAEEKIVHLFDDQTPSKSIGLRNIQARLLALYGPENGLVIRSSPGRGTTVRFRIPIREAQVLGDHS